ncbi:terpenoid cyclases/protein prenyltransferase alpha-alpha toroid [Aspergillus egyptiacus]|nr:terpenoid cyclases/protein prenyltransferase alpha-alpha toroid [Aspergillus egyptiacus]
MTSATETQTRTHFTVTSHDPLAEEARQSLQRAANYSFNRQHSDGHWCGELKSNATITAEYVMLRQALGLDLSVDRDHLIGGFLSDQNPDGSWGLAPHIPGDISTSVEAYFALKLLGVQPDTTPMRRAREFILSVGGVAKVRIFTRIFLATFGLFPWNAVPELPAELILLPAAAPVSIYRFSSWARSTVVPLLIISHHRPIFSLPNGKSTVNDFLDELWCNAAVKTVPYTPAIWEMLKTDIVALAFTLVDSVLHMLGGLRYSPTRSYARRKCIDWILDHQEEEGDWAGIYPPMHGGLLALCLEGYKPDDPPMRRGLEALERFAWYDRGGKRIQACVSPVWDTILTTVGLCDAGIPSHRTASAITWVKARQLVGPEGDWRVYQPNITPGGFSFEYFNRWYPDVDDTAAAILAMVKQDPQCRDPSTSLVVRRAVEWILGMQNRDGGWGAFDVHNDRLWLNKIPFSDMDSLCDPSTADVTGRILEAFGLLMQGAAANKYGITADLIDGMNLACDRAITYLARTQEPTGAWYGRWGCNYIYGTSNVLCGLVYFSIKRGETVEHDDCVKDCIRAGVEWLKAVQNADGGWGETLLSYKDPQATAGRGSPSTASQTAWALMGLLAHLPAEDRSVRLGVQYLLRTQALADREGEASWPEEYYTGTGFPNHFYLGYSLYPHYFPMMTLGRFVQAARREAAVSFS